MVKPRGIAGNAEEEEEEKVHADTLRKAVSDPRISRSGGDHLTTRPRRRPTRGNLHKARAVVPTRGNLHKARTVVPTRGNLHKARTVVPTRGNLHKARTVVPTRGNLHKARTVVPTKRQPRKGNRSSGRPSRRWQGDIAMKEGKYLGLEGIRQTKTEGIDGGLPPAWGGRCQSEVKSSSSILGTVVRLGSKVMRSHSANALLCLTDDFPEM